MLVVGLIRARDTFLAEQRELSKQKPRGKTDEALISEITRLESNITVTTDDLVFFFSFDSFDSNRADNFLCRERVNYALLGLRMN